MRGKSHFKHKAKTASCWKRSKILCKAFKRLIHVYAESHRTVRADFQVTSEQDGCNHYNPLPQPAPELDWTFFKSTSGSHLRLAHPNSSCPA
ncbi:hypothetical protein CHARACLAT_007231 [Characodon lateralis]|uniref:Uncharacterized protein n=1 Tax=Characodon lateralis TaxID=208331 RepID=A0ABU7E8B9_9TELE|nr:hypothetical protein [Characodon lateralis]